jgi:hypothetical protein
MLRKSLILGSITLLLVMLFAFTGCEGPVGPAGDPGDPGRNGNPGDNGYNANPAGLYYSGPDVSDVDLVAAFDLGDVVILRSGVETVSGEVPAGKKLVVLGSIAKVAPDAALIIQGTLDISGEAILTATGALSGDRAGVLAASDSAEFIGDGAVVLPYVLDGEFTANLSYYQLDSGFTADLLHFNSEKLLSASSLSRYPGSVFDNEEIITSNRNYGDSPRFLVANDLPDIFAREQVSELTVYNIQDLTVNVESAPGVPVTPIVPVIPANRKLTLKGPNNNIEGTAEYILGGGASLVVAKGATLESGCTITPSEAAKIINEGTIILGTAGRAGLPIGDGSAFTNNGTIRFSPFTDSDSGVKNAIGLWGSGTVELTPQANFGLGKIAVRQNIVIKGDGNWTITLTNNEALPFNGIEPGRSITIDKGASLALHLNNTGIGTNKVYNNGTLITPTRSVAALKYLWYETGYKGNVRADGALEATSVAGDDNGLLEDLEIPAGITLTLSASSTGSKLVSNVDAADDADRPFNITVKGTLILSAGVDLEPDGDFIVDGSLKLEGGSLAPKGSVVINGALDTGVGTVSSPRKALTIASGETLEIMDSSKIKGTTGLISVTDPLAFTIDGIKGFTVRNDGVTGADFQKALAAVLKADADLKSDITLPPTGPDSPYNFKASAVSVVGTVELSSYPGAYFISHTPNAVNDSSRSIGVDAGTEVITGGISDRGYSISGGTFLTHPNAFGIIINGGMISIYDTEYAGTGSIFRYAVVSFNTIHFVNGDLIGPEVDEFAVGVKTWR